MILAGLGQLACHIEQFLGVLWRVGKSRRCKKFFVVDQLQRPGSRDIGVNFAVLDGKGHLSLVGSLPDLSKIQVVVEGIQDLHGQELLHFEGRGMKYVRRRTRRNHDNDLIPIAARGNIHA